MSAWLIYGLGLLAGSMFGATWMAGKLHGFAQRIDALENRVTALARRLQAADVNAATALVSSPVNPPERET